MKIKLLLALLSTLALTASSAFAATPTEQTNNNAMVANSDQANKNTQNDAEIIGWLEVLNKNEIAAATLAKKKHVTGAVAKYADLMLTEHTKNLHATIQVSKKIHIPEAQTEAVSDLEKQGAEDKANLEAKNNQEFPKAYIDAMVQGHKDALKAIDGTYLKDVSNPMLKAHLQATRAHVNTHLELAKKIQSNLK